MNTHRESVQGHTDHAPTVQPTEWAVDEVVQCNYREPDLWLYARILCVKNNEKYDIIYDDESVDVDVPASNTRNAQLPPSVWKRVPNGKNKGMDLIINDISLLSTIDNINDQLDFYRIKSNTDFISSAKLDKMQNELQSNHSIYIKDHENLSRSIIDTNEKMADMEQKLWQQLSTMSSTKNNDSIITQPIKIDSAIEKKKEARITKIEDLLNSLQSKQLKQNEQMLEMQREIITLRSNEELMNIKIKEMNEQIIKQNNFIQKDIYENMEKQIKLANEGILQKCTDLVRENETSLRGRIDVLFAQTNKLDSSLRKCADSNYLLESLINSIETRGKSNSEVIEHLKHVQEDQIRKIYRDLQEKFEKLSNEKASKHEIANKADYNLLMTKVDFSEISRIDEYTNDLQRKLLVTKKEMSEGFANIEKNYSKRAENIALWCLKQIRKEMASEGGDGDIGKIRCLVCDQTIKQQPDQEIIGVQDNFTTKLKSKKGYPSNTKNKNSINNNRPSSPSNVHSSTLNKGSAPNAPMTVANATMEPLPSTLADYNKSKNQNDEKQQVNLPSIHNEHKQQDNPHLTVDRNINYVAPITTHLPLDKLLNLSTGGALNNNEQWLNPTHPYNDNFEREYVGNTTQQLLKQSQSHEYFKDLENKFTKGGFRNPASRPSSAPAHKMNKQ